MSRLKKSVELGTKWAAAVPFNVDEDNRGLVLYMANASANLVGDRYLVQVVQLLRVAQRSAYFFLAG